MSSNNKSRILYLDQLRALAIVTIIFVHVSNLWLASPVGSFNWDVQYFFKVIGYTGLPLFFMLSGALLLNRNYEIREFFNRRFSRVLYPFIFWMVIFIIVAVITQNKYHLFSSFALAVPYLIKSFTLNYWFIWMILGIYLAMPIINDFVKNRGLKGIEYYLLLLVITSVLITISKFLHYSLNYFNLALFFFAGPLGFVMLGYYLRYKKFKYSARTLMLFGLIIFLSTIALKTFLIWNGWFHQSTYKYFALETKSFLYMDILTILQPIGIFMFFKYLNEAQSGLIPKISSFLEGGIIEKLTISLSKSSYGIFLFHVILIDIIGIVAVNLLQRNALKWIPILILVVVLISWTTMVILNRIPYIRKVTGYY